jgi:PAP2 superfamily
VAFVLALCPLVASMAPAPAAPLARAHALIGVERSLGVFFEPAVHAWVAPRPGLMRVADFSYAAVHLPVMLGVLAWVWSAVPWRRLDGTRPAGDEPLRGDAERARCIRRHRSRDPRLPLTPSARTAGGRAVPPAVLLEIVATGNHIWLDAVAGAATAAPGFVLARGFERAAGSPMTGTVGGLCFADRLCHGPAFGSSGRAPGPAASNGVRSAGPLRRSCGDGPYASCHGHRG